MFRRCEKRGILGSSEAEQTMPHGLRDRRKCNTIILVLCCIVWFLVWCIFMAQNDRDAKIADADITGMQFFKAGHPYINYVGRWISTAGGRRREACFSDSYFDIRLNGSTRVILSIYNSDDWPHNDISSNNGKLEDTLTWNALDRYPSESLLVVVDAFEYLIYWNVSGVISIAGDSLDKQHAHDIRIIAPLPHSATGSCIQIKGIWLDECASLLPVTGSDIDINRQHNAEERHGAQPAGKNKWIEIVSDTARSSMDANSLAYGGQTYGMPRTVMKWEYLLGQMFGVDHTAIGVDGMCLVPDCYGGTGSPLSIAELYFRRLVYKSDQGSWLSRSSAVNGTLAETWKFPSQAPDVMVYHIPKLGVLKEQANSEKIFNLGTSDWASFTTYMNDYGEDLTYLSSWFEDAYVSLIQAIRNLAYSAGETELVQLRDVSSHSKKSNMPIFVMSPFLGQLEQATRSVVDRLHQLGDNSVYWLDTSGWLNTRVNPDEEPEDQDFFPDGSNYLEDWRLTSRGHHIVALHLHDHVCKFLARDLEECPFLPDGLYDRRNDDDDNDGPRFEEREDELDWKWTI